MIANQAIFPIAVMARVLGVSESGFHAWRHRPASAHATADKALSKRVRTIHASSRIDGLRDEPRIPCRNEVALDRARVVPGASLADQGGPAPARKAR